MTNSDTDNPAPAAGRPGAAGTDDDSSRVEGSPASAAPSTVAGRTAAAAASSIRRRLLGDAPPVARRTLLFDSLRSLAFGVLDTGPKTFFLLIAVRQFEASDAVKTLLSLPMALGLMGALVVVAYVDRLAVRRTRVAALVVALSGICFLVAATTNSLGGLTAWVVAAAATAFLTVPLYTATFKENYPPAIRGRLFAIEMVVAMIGSAVFHAVAGAFLETSISNYSWVIGAYGAINLLAAGALLFVPSRPRQRAADAGRGSSLFGALSWLWRDPRFGHTLGAWFTFGLGSVIVGPLRVLYLTEQVYGLVLPAVQVALIIGTVPDLVRLVFTPIWANLFDRYNFIGVRIALNTLSVAGIALFFFSRSVPLILTGAALYGAFNAGGNIAWNLWVTRFADGARTAPYMSVNTFATGIRMALGATVGIWLASRVGAPLVAGIALVLVLAGTALLVPLLKHAARFAASGERP